MLTSGLPSASASTPQLQPTPARPPSGSAYFALTSSGSVCRTSFLYGVDSFGWHIKTRLNRVTSAWTATALPLAALRGLSMQCNCCCCFPLAGLWAHRELVGEHEKLFPQPWQVWHSRHRDDAQSGLAETLLRQSHVWNGKAVPRAPADSKATFGLFLPEHSSDCQKVH